MYCLMVIYLKYYNQDVMKWLIESDRISSACIVIAHFYVY